MKADFQVQTPSLAYPVYVREGLPGRELEAWLEAEGYDRIFLIIDQHVEQLFGEQLRTLFGDRLSSGRTLIVPPGEQSKSTEQWRKIIDFLLEGGARRNTPVIAAGGGVTGDLAGFAAATALRGLPLVHIPTTLLAMVDSSIGGKTGINHPVGKNLVGSFYQPRAIFTHTGFLSELPRKEWINGLSEILKYAAIRQPDIFRICRELFLDREELNEETKLVELIRRCAKIKADVVAADERENKLRMILNFGHTFAHALERAGEYRRITHGEAVFVGMVAALHLSQSYSPAIDPQPIEQFRPLYRPDRKLLSTPVETLIEAMYSDKKRTSDRLKVVLLQEWGTPYVTELEETNGVASAWKYALERLHTP